MKKLILALAMLVAAPFVAADDIDEFQRLERSSGRTSSAWTCFLKMSAKASVKVRPPALLGPGVQHPYLY